VTDDESIESFSISDDRIGHDLRCAAHLGQPMNLAPRGRQADDLVSDISISDRREVPAQVVDIDRLL
jgi:hypothetical protein